jgi:chemotaxis protein CheC
MQYDYMFQEICKASTMKAASALSKFLKTPLKVDIKPIETESVEKIHLPSHLDEHVICLYVPIHGSLIQGGSSLILSQNSAFALCDILLNRHEGDTTKINDLEESALKEIANIILGNFLTPFAQSLLTATMMHSTAIYKNDSSSAVIKQTRSMLSESIKQDSATNIAFAYELAKIKGDINIVFESGTLNSLLKSAMVISNG